MATMGYMHNTCEQSLPKEREEEEENKEESGEKRNMQRSTCLNAQNTQYYH